MSKPAQRGGVPALFGHNKTNKTGIQNVVASECGELAVGGNYNSMAFTYSDNLVSQIDAIKQVGGETKTERLVFTHTDGLISTITRTVL